MTHPANTLCASFFVADSSKAWRASLRSCLKPKNPTRPLSMTFSRKHVNGEIRILTELFWEAKKRRDWKDQDLKRYSSTIMFDHNQGELTESCSSNNQILHRAVSSLGLKVRRWARSRTNQSRKEASRMQIGRRRVSCNTGCWKRWETW